MSTAPQPASPPPAPPSVSQTQHANRIRQLIYAVGIVFLFGAMWPYSQKLQEIKSETDLGEATIGQIDTGSFMVKLAMIGGFRGIVANWLWTQSIELQKQHEWDKLMASVEMITKLQPHFLSIWTFQGWNLAYNVSVEWDSPDDKYTWIKKGINFLRDGVAKNRNKSDLIWDTAWTYYHKLGMADEAIILRRRFYDDPDDDPNHPNFKVDPIESEPRLDNFQVAGGWFTLAVRVVDAGGERTETGVEGEVEYVDRMPNRKGRPGDLNFRSMPAHAQTRYAAAMEKMSILDVEPMFGQAAQSAWGKALEEWVNFGRHPFPAHNNPDELIYVDDASNSARMLSKELSENQKYWTNRWADQMNYRYWKDRSLAEAEPQGTSARRLFYEGTVALKNADFGSAVEKYKNGLDLWKDLLERHPTYKDDELNQKDTGQLVKRYVFALRQVGESPPDDMPFKDLYEEVKDESLLDPFDQLDMMRVPPKQDLKERTTP
ncbi:MAG TPA: hypothetical protein VFT74_01350 [Isosphaeraceae bacterium]|nr:hypothetical protein [Isosphaeraceae bacterium]